MVAAKSSRLSLQERTQKAMQVPQVPSTPQAEIAHPLKATYKLQILEVWEATQESTYQEYILSKLLLHVEEVILLYAKVNLLVLTFDPNAFIVSFAFWFTG